MRRATVTTTLESHTNMDLTMATVSSTLAIKSLEMQTASGGIQCTNRKGMITNPAFTQAVKYA